MPGVAQAEGEIKGAVASEDDLAIARYDTLTAEEIVGRLAGLSQIDLAKIDAYERQNEDRTHRSSAASRRCAATSRGPATTSSPPPRCRPSCPRATTSAPAQVRAYERATRTAPASLKAAERELTTA